MDKQRRIKGALLGFATADALGVPVEFTSREDRIKDPVQDMRGYGTHMQPPGTWSDDTSMTLCMIHSLLENGIDYDDQMSRFADWMLNGNYSAHNKVFDIGGTTRRSIENYTRGVPALECGETSERSCGNGSLMRIMPLAFYLEGLFPACKLDDRTADIIHKASDCTHAHKRCEMSCGVYCSVIFGMKEHMDLYDAVMDGIYTALDYYKGRLEYLTLYPEFETLQNAAFWGKDEVQSGGYALHTLQAAIWCLLTTKSYSECVLKAVNLGRDTDTTGAVAGSLAGMWYGPDAIPKTWLDVLAQKDELIVLSGRFAQACAATSGEEKGDIV